MSRNIVFEGWLTKSPPSKRIWRTKWRRRWFALRQSGELPGQYFLDYYADRNCRRLKGTINLDLCEQVDAGLHMERAGNGTLDPKLRGSVFTIQTQSRTYHLEADCEAEMEKWVDAICRVCGLRPTEEDTYQNNSAVSANNEYYGCADGTGPYIPISECITGVRARDRQSAFTFDPKNIVVSTQKTTCDKATETCGQHEYSNPPRIKITHVDFSENESNLSDEDCKSLNVNQSNIPDWSVTKSFTKLAVKPDRNGASEHGPPIPPRPPKTFARPKETFQGAKIQEPVDPVQDSIAKYTGPGTPWLRVPRRSSHYPTPPSPSRLAVGRSSTQLSDDEDDSSPVHQRGAVKFRKEDRYDVKFDTECQAVCLRTDDRFRVQFDAEFQAVDLRTEERIEENKDRKFQAVDLRTRNRFESNIDRELKAADLRTQDRFKRSIDGESGAMALFTEDDDLYEVTLSAQAGAVGCSTKDSAKEKRKKAGAVDFSTEESAEEKRKKAKQYYNLPTVPPVVDRALKPRYSGFSFGPSTSPPPPTQKVAPPTVEPCEVKLSVEGLLSNKPAEVRADTLQYLDLDLQPTTLVPAKRSDFPRKLNIIHGKSMSSVDSESAYKTVDFLKTEAFNSTRQDAEALRSYHY